MTRRPLAVAGVVGGALLVAVLAAGGAVGGYVATDAVRDTSPTPTPTRTTPAALRAVSVTPAPVPAPASAPAALTASRVAASLDPTLRASALGGDVHAQVTDLSNGTAVYGREASTPVAPASTAKLLDAAALLSRRSPDDRLTTTVRAGRNGDVVLVGGGDPTLSAVAAGSPTPYADAARLSDLAAAVRRSNVPVRRIVVDGSLFAGPTVSPDWAPEDVPSDYGSAITAVMVDGGRASPSATIRSSTPDLDAGRAFAAAIGRSGLPVVRGRAPADATTLGSVRSAPLSELISQMLYYSDNVIAECVARQIAIAQQQPVTFAGSAAAIRSTLRASVALDVGAGMVDASGLAARDRVSPASLVAVLRASARTDRLRDVITGLPTGGWTGTLRDRYGSASTRGAAGLVRAKTGTLTGVSGLAGLVHSRSGALLAFAFVTNTAGDTAEAEAALDVAVTRLAACGC